jgi:hypothetical protein
MNPNDTSNTQNTKAVKAITPHFGGAVSGEQFWPRPELLIRKHQLEFLHFNDCFAIDVPPLDSREEAKGLLNALISASPVEGWLDETTETLLDEVIAYYPSFIQHAFSRLRVSSARKRGQIQNLFAEQIRPDWGSTFYDQFDIRLKIYGADISGVYREVFTTLSTVENMMRDDLTAKVSEAAQVELSETLKILKEDGFLSRRAERDGSECWRFSSPLVSTWWQQRQHKKG